MYIYTSLSLSPSLMHLKSSYIQQHGDPSQKNRNCYQPKPSVQRVGQKTGQRARAVT